jgi:enamine deaminase RidA (YjgF/YER057c/UK114 family)
MAKTTRKTSRPKRAAAARPRVTKARPAGARRSRIRQVSSDRVSEPAGPTYSNCLTFGDTVFLAGMTASDGQGGMAGNGTPYGQARQCLLKIRRMLKAAGCSMRDVVKLTVYVTDIGIRPDVSLARAEFFSPPMPCSTLVQVVALADPRFVIEIDATAVRQGAR